MMKYFLPELYVRFQSLDDDQADAADADWERAMLAYDQRLEEIWEKLPACAHDLIERYYLHDAEVLSIARSEQSLIVTARLEPPPNECLIFIYSLAGEPRIDTAALPSDMASRHVQWMYDEFDVAPEAGTFSHHILLSNGWNVSLTFRALQLISAAELLPNDRMSADRGKSGGSLARTA